METEIKVADPPPMSSDAATLREIAATLSKDGYQLTARVLRDIARRIDTRQSRA